MIKLTYFNFHWSSLYRNDQELMRPSLYHLDFTYTWNIFDGIGLWNGIHKSIYQLLRLVFLWGARYYQGDKVVLSWPFLVTAPPHWK